MHHVYMHFIGRLQMFFYQWKVFFGEFAHGVCFARKFSDRLRHGQDALHRMLTKL
jgi:hypothetical protein